MSMSEADILQALIDDLEEAINFSEPAVVDIAPQDAEAYTERLLKTFRLSVLVARSKAISRARKAHQRKNSPTPLAWISYANRNK